MTNKHVKYSSSDAGYRQPRVRGGRLGTHPSSRSSPPRQPAVAGGQNYTEKHQREEKCLKKGFFPIYY